LTGFDIAKNRGFGANFHNRNNTKRKYDMSFYRYFWYLKTAILGS